MSIYNIFLGYGGISQYLINNSLRIRSSASAYLSRTPASASNRQTFTYSIWLKRGSLGSRMAIFDAYASSSGHVLEFQSDDTLNFYSWGSGATSLNLLTTQVFRDPSSWYHIVLAVDTTQATASNRINMYVNGAKITSFGAATYPSQNSLLYIDNNIVHEIGRRGDAQFYYDGYLAEVNFIDGQQLTPTSFGSYSTTTGVWQPIKYAGTYGTNGFYLNFNNTTSTTTLGYDSSGNSNNWTCNNISLTAGSTYDAMIDSPTLSAAASNYAVMNPVNKGVSSTVVDGNLTASISYGTDNGGIIGSIGVSSGKWYWEATITAVGGSYNPPALIIGVANQQYIPTGALGANAYGWAYYALNGNKLNNSSTSYGATYTTGDVIGIALDMNAGTLTFYKNNVSQGTAFTGLTGTLFPAISQYGSTTATVPFNFGQKPFAYTPPTGFSALNTYNLPTPAIANGALYNAATLYTGTGSSQSPVNSQSNGGNNALGKTFEPDLTWIKSRSAATDHKWTDTVRGVTKALVSDSTSAETTDTNGLTAFSSNGFTVGTDTNYNNSGATYVAWQWNAGSGTSGSNTNGSITSTVSVNQAAGFSIVTYTGTGSAATVGHGLGVAPSMIITKKRSSTSDWGVYHTSIGNTNYLLLDSTAASASSSTYWNNTSPTSSVFSIGTADPVNVNTATYVAYCFAPIAGYSAFGIYTGNGSTDGPFVYCGFRPRWVMVKSSTVSGSSSEWLIKDTSRDTYNVMQNTLTADSSQAEFSGSNQYIDILSNGFKIRNATGAYNNSTSDTYIYAAFAENPFRNALAR